MQNSNKFNVENHDSLEQNQQIQKLLFRILPFWPWVLLALVLGYIGARIYLRYATKIYAIKARVIVNDDSQQKTANLVDIVQLDTRNMSTETEKEMEILDSRNLLSNLVKNLQLNVEYLSKGYIKSGQNFKNVPFSLKLLDPDSVRMIIKSDVQMIGNNKVRFNNVIYPCDTFVESSFGKIKWHINSLKSKDNNDDWNVVVEPIADAVDKIQKSLSIEPISKQSSILAITYNDALPERGVTILTNLLSLYGTTTIDYKSRNSENTVRFLDDRLQVVSQELAGIEKKLQNFKTTNDIVDLSAQGNVVLDQLKQADTKLSELDIQMDVLNNIQEYVNKKYDSDNQIPASLGITDPVLNELLNQLYQAEFELDKTEATSGPKNPKINVLKSTIEKLKPSILASIQNLKAGIRVSKQQLTGDNDKLNSVLNKMPLKERQLLDINRQQGIKNGIYTFLLQKKEEAAITAAGIVANYRVIDKPEVMNLVTPIPKIIYLAAFLLALIIVSIFIYIKEFSSTSIKFRSQIEGRTAVPVISEIGYQPHKTDSPIVIEEGKRTLVAEEFRELRTNLNYLTFNSKENCKVILITSSIPSEGKSFISINTSISLCLTNKRVVLLEFDLRKPKISKELGISRTLGLSTYLINKTSAEEIVHPHGQIANFFVIPSGPIPPNPSELMSSGRLNELFKYLKENFDYIIIDSPPVRAVTDAKLLAKEADATLYIMRQNYTDSSFIDLVNDLHEKKLLPNLNIVFNGIKIKTFPGYSYLKPSYKYGYSYGYGFEGYSEDSGKKRNIFSRFFKRKD